MRRAAGVVLIAISGFGGLAEAAPAAPPPDRTGTATPAAPFQWDGPVHDGSNVNFDPSVAEPCGKDVANYCDTTLINVEPGDFYTTAAGGVEFSTRQEQDIDLFVYESDATGALGDFAGASAGPTGDERVSIIGGQGYYLVVVVYFAVRGAGYEGTAQFFRRNLVPFDVDDPPGLQDTLASDPSQGWRSRSEMHVAQSPIDPNVLVAGSKFYNRDPDSLPEYDFKVGSYASFDRARSWHDLGQINTCPQEQAPPALYPLGHRCYPADDPARDGTEPEDDPPGGDYGEDYITSDPWVDMDDEGNAYAMVLDSPRLVGGNGWGMSFHRWESVSREDVRRGRTWSDRIVINAYETPEEQATFLDDKNTFAVNNAGRDRDGRTGIIVACWGQNYELDSFGRQRIVCERSTDGGRTWPDEPTTISAPNADPTLPFGPFVIGVHVVADTRDPNTFYAAWLDTLSGFLPGGDGRSPMWFSKTTDGARTWEPARIIQRIDQVPGIFPRQSFRNLSLPILSVGPRSELAMVWANYNPAPYAASDEDGFQADIHLTTSLDRGASWSTPKVVNKDVGNADQFQPYVRTTASGQLNVFFFDRRFDRPDPPNHPGNFFIDNFLARSNDGGLTWSETRLSHDSWDPSINPPVSGSGEFIGDYQGLVADDCYAIPFLNDTHLANDPARDPFFDQGFPRSPFQQAFSYRVPNLREYGGVHPRGHTFGDLPRECTGKPARPPHNRPADRIHIATHNAKVDRKGRFEIALLCPRVSPAACHGTIRVSRRGDRLATEEFRISRGMKADVGLRLDHRGLRMLSRRGRLDVRVTVVPSDREVVRHDSTADVTLVWRPGSAHAARLSRGQARKLVAKYRMIAINWNNR